MTLLDVQNLTVTYHSADRQVPAVRGVSLTVAAGQTLGLAGESGSGKSTVALALLRLLPKTATVTGEILLNGKDILTMSWGALRAVRWSDAAVVFQGAMHALNPVRRIGEQIAEPIRIHGTATGQAVQTKVTDLLTQVGLPKTRARSYPHELSGGQRQRVMIAMALACEPNLLIADEPTTALDVMVQAQVLTLLADLVAQRDIGLIMISHDLSVLGATCQRLAVMYAGRIIEQGPSTEVIHRPVHPYSAALADAFPTIGDPASRMAPRGLPGDPPDPADLPTGCPFHPRCPISVPSCAELDIELRAVNQEHAAACIKVQP